MLCLCGYDGCHSEERSDEESHAGREAEILRPRCTSAQNDRPSSLVGGVLGLISLHALAVGAFN
jgi:hypothetical protein